MMPRVDEFHDDQGKTWVGGYEKGWTEGKARGEAKVERLQAEVSQAVDDREGYMYAFHDEQERANTAEAEVKRLRNERNEYMAELTKRLNMAEDEVERLKALAKSYRRDWVMAEAKLERLRAENETLA